MQRVGVILCQAHIKPYVCFGPFFKVQGRALRFPWVPFGRLWAPTGALWAPTGAPSRPPEQPFGPQAPPKRVTHSSRVAQCGPNTVNSVNFWGPISHAANPRALGSARHAKRGAISFIVAQRRAGQRSLATQTHRRDPAPSPRRRRRVDGVDRRAPRDTARDDIDTKRC